LRRKSGADFDKAYVADQYALHSNALTLYGDYMLLGANAKLNALVSGLYSLTSGYGAPGTSDLPVVVRVFAL
jgi:predicted outer membrane protein